MTQAHFTFHGDLVEFLQPSWRIKVAKYSFQSHQTVKHLIEAAGIPHTEVARIEANTKEVAPDYQVQDNDEIEVYPFDSQAHNPVVDAKQIQFLLDNHLGKLARRLRMLGFDCLYENDYQDDHLAEIAFQTGRILLTRDRRLLMRNTIRDGYCLRSTSPDQQAVEILNRYQLFQAIEPFTRCLFCNELLQPIAKEKILDRLMPLTMRYFDQFQICSACNQIYWRGSHHAHMQSIITQLLQSQVSSKV